MSRCPICSEKLHVGADRCPSCGYRLRNVSAAPMSSDCHRLRRGCCVAPILILLTLVLIPVLLQMFRGLFVQLHRDTFRSPDPEPVVSVPSEEYATIPTASEGCFIIAEGILMFRPDVWDGGTVLSVPETVDGQTVTAIGPGCFHGCAELTTILLPETVTSIGPEAFAGCSRLRGLFVPRGTVSIGRDAFAGCTDLESVFIPSSVELIAPGAFEDCASLLYLFYDGTFESWNSLYSGYITPFTTAICLDGNYIHGTQG